MNQDSQIPLLSCKNLTLRYPILGGLFRTPKGYISAVNDLSLEIKKGEVLGLVGESGCGKSSLGRTLIRLERPESGTIRYNDVDITHLGRKEMVPYRKKMQFIFQDPLGALNPRMNVETLLEEPYRIHKVKNNLKLEILKHLNSVGIDESALKKFPHEFSGGQRQRICIARALTLQPELIIADEPVSALDVSIQSQVLNLLRKLKEEYHLSLIFIAHNLSVVRYISDRIAVMYLGEIVETGTPEEITDYPLHPYTKALVSAIPNPVVGLKKERILLKGDLPSASNPPAGCRFHTRCFMVDKKCSIEKPALLERVPGRSVACHFADNQ